MAVKTKPQATLDQVAKIKPRRISGILVNRDRPANSGWCGAEGCAHLSHQKFNRTVGKA